MHDRREISRFAFTATTAIPDDAPGQVFLGNGSGPAVVDWGAGTVNPNGAGPAGYQWNPPQRPSGAFTVRRFHPSHPDRNTVAGHTLAYGGSGTWLFYVGYDRLTIHGPASPRFAATLTVTKVR